MPRRFLSSSRASPCNSKGLVFSKEESLFVSKFFRNSVAPMMFQQEATTQNNDALLITPHVLYLSLSSKCDGKGHQFHIKGSNYLAFLQPNAAVQLYCVLYCVLC